ncbi:DNA cytosine methyltransferase [uncultured Bacteroides sp.]|uniref:DNA cytosine methyltransferase n=1 Tax=uncultured Bacteroides sp. TaxID=162156 RepID=UPI00280BBF14|nr:DNA cytosine methyltransferase [uncultured Bacteroides sp.]
MNNKKQSHYTVIDLFAGAGGFGLGFQLANKNFKVACSLEIDKWAIETLMANNTHNQIIIHGDIRKYNNNKKILDICPIKPDVIIGGPPCQGFSHASGKKDPSDPRNSLFKNYAQWVKTLKPKVFVMENVRGLLNGTNEKGEKVIDIITKTFKKIGYTVNIWELNAANYGVPQIRERIFIVGSSDGISISPPEKTHFLSTDKETPNANQEQLQKAITVIQAIGDLPKLKAGEGSEVSDYNCVSLSDYQNMCRFGATHLFNHVTMKHTKRVVERYQRIIEGQTLAEIPKELQVRKRNGNGELSEIIFSSNYRHLKPNMVAYTIPASFYSNFIHPTQPRNITSREAARLQSFPDYYIFKGKRTQISSKLLAQLGKDDENYLSQYNQIGNAVPPLLAKAIALRIFNYLESRTTDNQNKVYNNKRTVQHIPNKQVKGSR